MIWPHFIQLAKLILLVIRYHHYYNEGSIQPSKIFQKSGHELKFDQAQFRATLNLIGQINFPGNYELLNTWNLPHLRRHQTLGKFLPCVYALDLSIVLESRAFLAIIVYNCQDAKTVAVEELVSHEIHTPDRMHPSYIYPFNSLAKHPATTRTFYPQAQASFDRSRHNLIGVMPVQLQQSCCCLYT